MDLLGKFQSYIKREKLLQPKSRLLIAVSGGIDSVVLCDLCSQSGFDFAIAHCNFQLRGKESDEDEGFVRKLAKRYKAEIFIQQFDTELYAKDNKCSIQVAARELRYAWFDSILDDDDAYGFKYLLTAHHANDNIETLLMNFFKGTGITGLQGILPKSGHGNRIIRPLLFAKKEELKLYAKKKKIAYREDSSNDSNKYTRNFLRNKIIPAIEKAYPQVEDNLLNNIARFNEVNIVYQKSIESFRKKLLVEKKGEWHLPVLKLLKTVPLHTILFEILKEFDFTPGQTADISRLLYGESGKYIDSPTHRVLRNREWLIISKTGSTVQGHFLIEENEKQFIFSDQLLIIERKDKLTKINPDPAIAQLDARHIKFPLLLRKWKQGDYFYPLGMKKKKKLSRFFIDNKLSLTEKENTWVIEMDKKIIWIVGRRIDDRFKIGDSTKDILKLTVSPA